VIRKPGPETESAFRSGAFAWEDSEKKPTRINDTIDDAALEIMKSLIKEEGRSYDSQVEPVLTASWGTETYNKSRNRAQGLERIAGGEEVAATSREPERKTAH
jgi:hypothetical protein